MNDTTDPDAEQDTETATEAAVNRIRAQVMGIPIDTMTDAEIATALAAARALANAEPYWLLQPRANYDSVLDGIEQTATAMIRTARDLDATASLGDALYDVLINAASHRPAVAERSDGTPMPDPWGCEACGTADGTNACETWASGIRVVRALAEHGDTLRQVGIA